MLIRIIIFGLLLAAAGIGGRVMAQDKIEDEAPVSEPAPTPGESASREEEDERLAEIVGADEESESGKYEQEEDDDFVPTQEVSADQSVNFPVDI